MGVNLVKSQIKKTQDYKSFSLMQYGNMDNSM